MLLQPVPLLLSIALPLLLLTFSSPVISRTACVHGTCLGDRIPFNCDSAAIYPVGPVPAGRRRARRLPSTSLDTSVDSSPSITPRGNAICYYVNGRLSDSIGPLQVTHDFVIPAGTWALKWALRNPGAITFYFKLFTRNPNGMTTFLGAFSDYGHTFVSDGITEFFVMLVQRDLSHGPQHAELWVNAA